MAESEVIREYIIKLGYKVEQTDVSRVEESLGKTTAAVTKFGLEVMGAAAAVSAMVLKITDKYTDLYHASIRTGVSASHLNAFSFGMRQVGISAEQSTAMLEKLNISMMTNPGMRKWIDNFFQIKTAGKEVDQIAKDILSSMSKMSPYRALMGARGLGWSESDIIQIMSQYDELNEAFGNYNKMLDQFGVNEDALATKSETLQRKLNRLGAEFLFIPEKIAMNFIDPANSIIEFANKWIGKAGEAGKATGGWSSTLLAFGGALAGIKGAEGLLRLVAWILRSLGWGGTAAATGAGAGILGMLGTIGTGVAAGYGLYKTLEPTPTGQEPPLYNNDGSLTEQGKKLMGEVQAGKTSFTSNAPPSQSALGQSTWTSPGGAQFTTSSKYAPYFKYFTELYEKAGGKIGAHGGLRPGDPRKHGWGGAIDVDEYGAGGRRTKGALPEWVENRLAFMAGLYPGSMFKSNYDPGHFEVSAELRKWVEGGGTFEEWKRMHQRVTKPLSPDEERAKTDPLLNPPQNSPYHPKLSFDESRLSPSVTSTGRVQVTQSNSIVANGIPGPEPDPISYSDRFAQWNDDVVRYSKISLV